MKYSWAQIVSRCLLLFCFILPPFLLSRTGATPISERATKPVVLTARIENGSLVYRINGKRVENSIENSLLVNLGNIVKTRGAEIPVFIVIDVRAPFTEISKLGTALDKAGLTHRRFFVSYFHDGTMNEIHWDDTSIPIPQG
ncbi:MAG: hypothetical protein WB994_15710 [Candidatus Acidiferrum sp.]